ncbi:unnamed protein product [Cylicostephanus goldi]|uniref:Uncharacterized protein n=1 Tax=Cylicostephanus goldi TaxID=71465 RepID=A0A3P6QMX6_CYLGO|nr:unnamed protein product [Cylicostephanus goldi]
MSAVINSRPTSSAAGNSIGEEARPDSTKNPVPALLHKIEGHVARVNDVYLLSKEEGVWTCSDDRSVRLYLKRDNGQFWPSIHKIMPVAPTCLYYSEETSRLLVGLLNGHVYEYHVADDYNTMSDPEARRVLVLFVQFAEIIFIFLSSKRDACEDQIFRRLVALYTSAQLTGDTPDCIVSVSRFFSWVQRKAARLLPSTR